MPTLQHPLPSFSLVLSQGRDSPALPDYYRTTRHEKYGPYLRSSTAAQDCMVSYTSYIFLVPHLNAL